LVDREAVDRRLREIDSRVSELREVQLPGRDRFLSDRNLVTLTERHLQVALQAAIDIAVQIVAEDSAETPEDYASAFLALGRIGVVDGAVAQRLASAAKLRNILVHMYLKVDPQKLWDALQNLDDLDAFAQAVEGYLSR
jgi:uncharacterized protein YutE (UPF0331/DUF86 family)